MTSPHSIRDVVAQMIAVVPEEALGDLQDEDPASAVEVHFEPVRVHRLPRASIRGEDCSVDGYYEVFIDPDRPRILYSNDVVPERARFTIIHELGHHIFNTTGAWLLDDLDRIGGSALGAHRAEEAACHRFAGEVLVPTGLLDDVIGSDALTPKHVVWLRETTNASWEALAVRAANYSGTTTAVALVRSPGEVSFVTANGLPPWPRGSRVQPGGPLDRSLRHRSTRASPEVYRYGLGGAAALFCDTVRVDAGLAVAVLSPRRSDGGLTVLEPLEPAWKEREEFCAWCNAERDVSWCYECSGRRCRDCERCGCAAPIDNPVCPKCYLQGPFRAGATVCVDCEAIGSC